LPVEKIVLCLDASDLGGLPDGSPFRAASSGFAGGWTKFGAFDPLASTGKSPAPRELLREACV